MRQASNSYRSGSAGVDLPMRCENCDENYSVEKPQDETGCPKCGSLRVVDESRLPCDCAICFQSGVDGACRM